MTLNEVMKDTAEAIREKTGKSELIKPVDFATEIKGITAGGGSGESGGEIYIKEEPEKMTDLLIGPFSYLTKIEKLSGGKSIIPSAQYFAAFSINPEEAPTPLSYMVLGDTYIDTDAGRMKIKDRISQLGMELTEITKEQFYTLD